MFNFAKTPRSAIARRATVRIRKVKPSMVLNKKS